MSKPPLPELPFAIGGSVWPGLSKLTEECGEVGQVIGKLMGTGGATNHWDGSNLAERLTDEMGDVLAAIEFVADKNRGLIDFRRLMDRRGQKLALFEKWHREQVPLPAQVEQKWVIEFRSGKYLGLLATSVPLREAVRYSKEDAEQMVSVAWIAMNGGMVVPEPACSCVGPSHGDTCPHWEMPL